MQKKLKKTRNLKLVLYFGDYVHLRDYDKRVWSREVICSDYNDCFGLSSLAKNIWLRLSKTPKPGFTRIWIRTENKYYWRWSFEGGSSFIGRLLFTELQDILDTMFKKTGNIRPIWVKMERRES